MATSHEPFVVVVGAGPSGLLLALLLARRGVPVQLIDLANEEDDQPRATHYGPPAVYELERAGVLDDVRAEGFLPSGVAWRAFDLSVIAELDATVLEDYPHRMVCLPLNRLSKILVKHLENSASATIHWQHKVLSLGQDDDSAWVQVDTPAGLKTISAPYIVGCDGANSQIRRSLFGQWEFPGTTWKEQVVATNIYYDFYKYGLGDANFIVDRENWYMASRITNDGLWRVTYGDVPGHTTEELRARLPEKFRTMLPGNPGPDDYKLANFSPYKVHQRLAKKMRVGRFCLAADAAHLCNPFGGLGLTGGMVDVGGLYDCLAGIFEGKADDSILDKYDEVRRTKYSEIINPVSTENFKRVFDQTANEARERDDFLILCKTLADDPQKSKEFQMGANAIQHDFTQYYNEAETLKEGRSPNGPVKGTAASRMVTAMGVTD
ncbi:FAD binding domain-containing protein [Aureobasidium pullulans]|nr:FAD binding domain-containing protein [Aureobasidium pullulans]